MASLVLGSLEVKQGGEGGKSPPAGNQETEVPANNTILCYLPPVPVHLWAAGPRFSQL